MGSKSETLVKFNNWVSDVGFLLGQLLLDHLFSVYSDGKSDSSSPPPPQPLRMLSSINNFYKYLGQTLLAVIPTLPLMIIRSILRVKHHYLASIFKGWGSYYLYRIKLTNSNYLLSYYPQWS